jgi:pyridoxamine 5'-phosphate oxidase
MAKQCREIKQPTAMILATVDAEMQPSARTMLLKGNEGTDFLFFTNSRSRKGRNLAIHPKAALTFYWDALFRQVHIRGTVSKIDQSLTEAYWKTRPRESQLSQWLSHQSEPLEQNQSLDRLLVAARERWEGQDVPCPTHWNGYSLAAQEIEFWIGETYRLHQRFIFTKTSATDWEVRQYYP